MRRYLVIPLLLAACVETGPGDAVVRDDPADACGAAGWAAQLVGGTATDALTALLPLSSSNPAGVRVIFPGTAVTMDYRPERLNVEIDEADIVARVYCG